MRHVEGHIATIRNLRVPMPGAWEEQRTPFWLEYQARCSCGYVGESQISLREARGMRKDHLLDATPWREEPTPLMLIHARGLRRVGLVDACLVHLDDRLQRLAKLPQLNHKLRTTVCWLERWMNKLLGAKQQLVLEAS